MTGILKPRPSAREEENVFVKVRKRRREDLKGLDQRYRDTEKYKAA